MNGRTTRRRPGHRALVGLTLAASTALGAMTTAGPALAADETTGGVRPSPDATTTCPYEAGRQHQTGDQFAGELPRVFYRVDTRPPEVVFRDGFSAWGSNMDLVRHTINTRDRSSGFVALTDDLGAANQIANDYLSDLDEAGNRRYERVWVYRVAPGGDVHNVNRSLERIEELVQQRVELGEQQVRGMCGGEERYRLQTEIMAWGTYLAFTRLSAERHAAQREWVSTGVVLGERVEAGAPLTRPNEISQRGERLWDEAAIRHEDFDGTLMNVPPSRELLTGVPADRAALEDSVKRIRKAFREAGVGPSGSRP
ncbi:MULTISPECIES: hypothetical protein [Bacteria]|uniref:hypothetical protein n=1 Tax=Bacteria TaxID=2 RepID=UPI003C7AB8F0